MKKIAILLMFITILTKLLGFARDIILSYFYGASNISDVYLISLTIPMVIFKFISVGIATGYIPMYSRIEKNHGVKIAYKYTNNLINILLIICTIMVTLGLLFTEQIVKIFASGFEGETLVLAVKFTKVSLFAIYSVGLINIFNALFQIKGRYLISAIGAIPLNLFYILSIFYSAKSNIMILPIGSLMAVIAQLLFLIFFIGKTGYRYQFIIDLKDKHIKNMMFLALPVIIGVSVDQINILVDRTIASQITEGGISALNYANRLNLFVQGVFVMTITTILYPKISKLAAENNITELKKSVLNSINAINILLVPATVGFMVFAEELVGLLFGRGAFDSKALYLTSYALFFYSIGMIGYGLREVLTRTFYSLQDTKTPMINATISMVLNIILNIILSKYFGIGGLALATSISAIICTLLLFRSLIRKIGSIGIKYIIISFTKILCGSLAMGLTAKLIYEILINSLGEGFSLVLSMGIGVVVYFVLIYILKVDGFQNIVKEIKKKVH